MVDGVSDDVRDVMIDQRVHGLSSLALDSDEPGASEHPKMLGYQWLAHLQLRRLRRLATAATNLAGAASARSNSPAAS